MSQFGARNQPWARGAGAAQLNPQLAALGGLAGMGGQLAMPQGMSLGGQLGGATLNLGALGGQMMLNAAAFAQPQQLHVSYGAVPTRQVQAAQVSAVGAGIGGAGGAGQKNQRAFIGVVTKMHDNYGFVDDDVFFQTTVVKGPLPRVGERVMVEASYNANMPFKWNASRIQVLPNQDDRPVAPPPQAGPMRGMQRDEMPRGGMGMGGGGGGGQYQRGGDNRDDYYRGGPPPVARRSPIRRPSPPPRRRSPSPQQRYDRGVKRERERSPLRPPRESPRRSESRVTDKSGRKSSASPPRRRAKVQPRYSVKVPPAVLNIKDASVAGVRHRFSNMYIPSDFFHAMFNCVDSFPVYRPFSIQHEAAFHIMNRNVDPPVANNAVWDPPDVDYRFSAKVMLLSMPPSQEFLKKSLCMQPDGTADLESTDYDPSPIIKEVSFLIGLKGRSEYLAIGGPWSPSLDGVDPENDPRVLVKTAIRTCKALTGIDLSKCTQWYKFVELRYRRCDKEKPGDDARVESVVIYVPDVWTLMPTQAEFDAICARLKEQLANKLAEVDAEEEQEKQQQQQAGGASSGGKQDKDLAMDTSQPTTTKPEDEEEQDEGDQSGEKQEPTPWNQLDIKKMKVAELRTELQARGLDTKGIKSQLVSRLQAVLTEEEEKDKSAPKADQPAKADEKKDESAKPSEPLTDDKKEKDEKDEKRKKEQEEKEKQRQKEKAERERKERKTQLERHYKLPSTPGIMIYPHKEAKSGKFDCKVMSLKSMLEYSKSDAKEHSFEVNMFAELFQEMLTRDAAFKIYKALLAAPEAEEKSEGKAAENGEKKINAADAGEELQVKDEVKDDEKEKDAGDKKKDEKRQESAEKTSSVMKIVDPDLLLAFTFFDQTHCGFLYEKDVDEILQLLDVYLSRSQIHKLLQKPSLIQRNERVGDRLEYRKLTDVPKAKEEPTAGDESGAAAAASAEPQIVRLPLPDDKEIAIGNTLFIPTIAKQDAAAALGKKLPAAGRQKAQDVSDQPVVMFRGSMVDIGQMLDQLQRLEVESRSAEQKCSNLDQELKSTKTQNQNLDKKVKSLEKEKDHYQRKWKDTEKSLKTMSDEKGSLGKTLKDIRDDAERIVRSVDKAVPTLKSEKDKKKDEKKEGLAQKGTEAKSTEEQNHMQDEDLAVQDEVVDEKMEMEQESPAVALSE